MQETEAQVAEVTEKITSIKNRREERQRKRRLRKAVIAAVTAVCVLFGTAAYTGLRLHSVAEADENNDVRETAGGSLSGKTVILHSGDAQGAIDGYAKMAALKKEFEADGADVIVADAGGYSSGDGGDGSFGPKDGFAMMRVSGYDVAALGDAEFAEGYDKLKSDIGGAKIRLVCTNVLKDGKTILKPDYIYETSGGSKIGFMGLTAPASCEGLEFLSGDAMIDAAKSEADSLKSNGADAVIALTYLGTDGADSSVALYKNVDGIDFIIDGHSHEAKTSGADGEPIQSTGEKFANIGVIVLGSNGSIEDHYIMSTDKIGSDEGVQADADKIKERTTVSEVGKESAEANNNTAETKANNNTAETKDAQNTTAEDEAANNNTAEKSVTENAVRTETENTETAATDKKEDEKITSDAAEVTEAEEDGETAAATEQKPEDNKKEIEAEEQKAEEEKKEAEAEEKKAADELASLNGGKYEVVKGDCLWNIAKKYLGDGARWGEIYELNKGIISNPSLIYVGQQLVLPPG